VSADFVPEAYPRCPSAWDTTDAEIDAQRSAQAAKRVLQCSACGCLWDEDGPRLCPECETYTDELTGASFESGEEWIDD
jgi:hypothetical protein